MLYNRWRQNIMYLGEIIYDYRAKNKLTLKQFSERSDLSVAYLSQLENNRNPKTGRPTIPSPETFFKVAKAMNMDVEQLFREVDQNQPVCLSGSSSDSNLTKDEEILLSYFRAMNREGRDKLTEYAEDLAASGRYIKNDQDCMVDEEA